jgi:ATP-dependent Clp protease ATP-binding subunit ClpA
MTTNAGAQDLARSAFGFTRQVREGDDAEAINRMFSPEFRNRLDATIPFDHLPTNIVRRGVEKFIMQLEAQLAERQVIIELTDEAADWLAQRGYDQQMGARPLARVIQEHVKKPLADEVLFGKLKKGGTVKVSVETKEDGTTGLKLEAIEDAPVTPKPEPVPKATRPRRKPKPAAGNDGPPEPDQPNGGRRGGLVPKVPLKTG